MDAANRHRRCGDRVTGGGFRFRRARTFGRTAQPSAQRPLAPRPTPEPATATPPATPTPPQTHPRAPVAVVHQFHPDAAPGDAITNAMLMLRRELRAIGFESDIFVARRPPALQHEVKLADSIPRHDGYVLLAHHSMGYDEFPDILALPARKVLVYHNITPPQFLSHAPRLQRNAELGRTQLPAWRSHAAAALALSEYSATELRRLGFPAVRSCNLLFDPETLQRRAAASRIDRDPAIFTILFVGRVTASKAQDDLIAAYAQFRRLYAGPSRLVLAGAFDPAQYTYLDRLDALILEHALADHVLLTGWVDDGEIDAWYARADLYVSLSHHEGFGVPLIEAMAHAIPVLAWPAGAIPYTLDGAATLLASRAPDAVANQMRDLANDPDRRAAQTARQTASLARFALPAQRKLLQEALALAGAQPRPAASIRASVAANAQFTLAGHVNGSYSLAAVNRTIAATIEARRPGAIRLIPAEGAPTADRTGVPAAARAIVDALAERGPPVSGPDIVLSQHYPVYVPEHRGDLLLALVFWEESLLSAATVETLNDSFDGVLAPSAFVARLLVESGVSRPVITIGQAPDLAWASALQIHPAGRPFRFLHVSSAFPRKGLDVLLAAWRRAFRATDDVELVIKTTANIHNDAAGQVERLRLADPDAAPILLIDADLDGAAHAALYATAGAMVLPTRGEGYNLPAAEAMAAGLALIVTDRGGHRDFCGPGTARLVRSRAAPASTHLSSPHSLWREPDEADLAAALQDAARHHPAEQITAARSAIAAAADPDAFVDRLADASAALILAGPAPPARLAWITSWNVTCGVANYAQALAAAMPQAGIARLAILCDDRTAPDGDQIRPCWSLDPAIGLGALITAVENEDAGIVLIQHQPGLIPWPALATLLAALDGNGRTVAVILHNTAHLLTIEPTARAAATAALAGVARILVHTIADIDRLEALGLQPTLLPHSAPARQPAQPARDLPPDSDPVIGCYGFFLPGKGIPTLIEAVALLRAQWPAITLRLVNAVYGDPASLTEIAACRALAADSNVTVEWHLDYLPDAASTALLAGCDAIILPYAPSRESSSAAVRWALASGVPVAVSPVPIFDELGGSVARLPSDTPAALAEGIAALLNDRAARQHLGQAAERWLDDHARPGIARRLHGLLLGLAAQRHVGAKPDGSLWSG